MGKVWVRTTYGKLIHLPVVGDDINRPGDPDEIPTSMLVGINRCHDQDIIVNHPVHGLFTIRFVPPGRSGSCNQCGMCCGHPVAECPPEGCHLILDGDINWHVCEYLVIKKKNKWGDPGNTECGMYDDVLDGFKSCVLWPEFQSELDRYPQAVMCDYVFGV